MSKNSEKYFTITSEDSMFAHKFSKKRNSLCVPCKNYKFWRSNITIHGSFLSILHMIHKKICFENLWVNIQCLDVYRIFLLTFEFWCVCIFYNKFICIRKPKHHTSNFPLSHIVVLYSLWSEISRQFCTSLIKVYTISQQLFPIGGSSILQNVHKFRTFQLSHQCSHVEMDHGCSFPGRDDPNEPAETLQTCSASYKSNPTWDVVVPSVATSTRTNRDQFFW
jgi:hypothetical protein